MEINLIEEIKSLNQSIIKKLFCMNKSQNCNTRPKPLQMAILDYLIKHNNENVCQKDLENSLKISKAAISDVIKAMEKNKLIVRIASTEDARKNIITLTDESINMYKELAENINAVNNEILNCLTEEEAREFLRITEKLKRHMKEGN